MKTKLLYFCLGVFAIAAIAAQLQTYPQVTVLGATDLIPFSQNQGGGNFNSPVNITAQNFANQLAAVGGYGVLNLNNLWTAGGFHQGPETFIGGLTLPVGPVNSILRINPLSVVTYVTIGSNLNMDGNGVLSATFAVTTNSISLPLTIANGGTGSTTASAALLGLGAARLDGTTQFPNLLDQGPATNQLMVLEQLPNGQQFTSIGSAPGNGYSLGSTNTTPGVAWFPNPASTRATGNTTATGWTNNTGVPCAAIFGTTANTIWVLSDTMGPYSTNTFGGPTEWTAVLSPGSSYTITFGVGFVGQYHSILQ